MRVLLAFTVALGLLAAAAAFLSVHGLTLLDRWALSPDLSTFAARTWNETRTGRVFGAETRRAPDGGGGADRKQRSSRSGGLLPRAPPGELPAESHSASDRAALDRLVAGAARGPSR